MMGITNSASSPGPASPAFPVGRSLSTPPDGHTQPRARCLEVSLSSLGPSAQPQGIMRSTLKEILVVCVRRVEGKGGILSVAERLF